MCDCRFTRPIHGKCSRRGAVRCRDVDEEPELNARLALLPMTLPEASPDLTSFIPFVKAVGRGSKLRRDLTTEEGRQAMGQILRGEATPAQIGAFLIAQRVKGEAETEIRGFTQAVRDEFMHPISPHVDGMLDLGIPYDGKIKTAQ